MKQTLNLRTRDSNDPATIYYFFFSPVQCILGKKKHVTIVEGEIAKFLRFFYQYTSFLIMCQTLFFLSSYIYIPFSFFFSV